MDEIKFTNTDGSFFVDELEEGETDFLYFIKLSEEEQIDFELLDKDSLKITFHYEKDYWIIYERNTFEDENVEFTDFVGSWTATENHNSFKGGDPDPTADEREIKIKEDSIEFPNNGLFWERNEVK